MKRVLHLVRDPARPPAMPIRDGDRVVSLADADPAEVVHWVFEYDVVIVW